MLGNLKRAKFIVLAILGSFLVSVSVFAQITPPQIRQTPQLVQPQFTVIQLKNATTRLNSLETVLKQVERKKVATLKDTEAVEQAAFAYAEAMKAGLDNAWHWYRLSKSAKTDSIGLRGNEKIIQD